MSTPRAALRAGLLAFAASALATGAAARPAGDDDLRVAPVPPVPPVSSMAGQGLAPVRSPRLADLAAREQAERDELAGLGAKVSATRARSVNEARALYKLTRVGLLPVAGGFGELVRHAHRVERARRGLHRELGEERRLHERAIELAQDLERIEKDRTTLEAQEAAAALARGAAEDEGRRSDAFARAFEGGYVAVHDAVDDGPTGFALSRGKLLFPVTARADVRQARHEGTEGPGLEIRAPLGTAVRAVYAGRVAFADRYGPYGRLVIVDHGEHYYSVSGGLASVDVKVGDELAAGDRLGAVGDEGQGAMLYFEIRQGTRTVAPGPWLGLSH